MPQMPVARSRPAPVLGAVELEGGLVQVISEAFSEGVAVHANRRFPLPRPARRPLLDRGQIWPPQARDLPIRSE